MKTNNLALISVVSEREAFRLKVKGYEVRRIIIHIRRSRSKG